MIVALKNSSAKFLVLLHLVDGTASDPVADYQIIQEELHAYGRGLASRPQILAINKADAIDAETTAEIAQELKLLSQSPIFLISAVSRQGLNELLQTIWTTIDRQKEVREAQEV